jgi:uncharacterized protein (TIGR03790 family)
VRLVFALLTALGTLAAQSGANVLLVVNRNDADSRQVADYYRSRRGVPQTNVCSIATTSEETISWQVYLSQIETPVENCLKRAHLEETVLYIVTTLGVPLRIDGAGGSIQVSEHSSVDSDLALLYAKLKGVHFPRAGAIPNPYFSKRDMPFRHPGVPIYMVTRLAANDLAGVKAMIDYSLAAKNRGKFVIDAGASAADGNNWLRAAAMLLPRDRVVLDDSDAVLYNQADVIGYASWGSNDGLRKHRWSGFSWLPGAIVTEFVSTNARTLKRPPANWNFTTFADKEHWFGGSPQGLSADYLAEGATGVSGNVFEPFLGGCVRPEYVLPAYAQGRNLAESYYMALPYLSWQGVIFGDPLCSLGKP